MTENYYIKRQRDGNKKKYIPLAKISNFSLEEDDQICPDDGKEIWYYYAAWKSEHSSDAQIEPQLIPDKKKPKKVLSPLILDTKVLQEDNDALLTNDDEVIIEPSKPTFTLKRVIVFVALLSVAYYIFIKYQKSPTTSTEISTPADDLMKIEIEGQLSKGTKLVYQYGNHSEANIYFKNVQEMIAASSNITTKIVENQIAKFNNTGDSLCTNAQSIKSEFMLNMASEYYTHAAILANKNPKNCK
jgi:hypothetical protein